VTKAAEYLSGVRETVLLPWPGTGKQVALLLLSCADVQDAAFEAAEHFARRRQRTDGVLTDLFQWEWEYQLVARMLLDPDSKRPQDRIFTDATQLRAALTPDLVQWFLDRHAELRLQHARAIGLQPEDNADG
jgi:hypothetical protein